MPYKVQFLGLAFFFKDNGENGGRRVLLPDGRNPPADVQTHFAAISVAQDAILKRDGWEAGEETSVPVQIDKVPVFETEFAFPPSTISLEGADVPGPFDATALDPKLPSLATHFPGIEIEPRNAIADIAIRQGTLSGFRWPGRLPLIGQLEVNHDGDITITVTPRDGSAKRTILLKPGTEIAIVNTSRGFHPAHQQGDHFRIYGGLAVKEVPMTVAAPAIVGLVASPSRHLFFTAPRAATTSTDCSLTGGPP